MKKLLTIYLLLHCCIFSFGQDATKNKKILIVATNTDKLNGKENGTYLIELIFPLKYFIDGGFDVDITTPRGGKVAIYGAAPEKIKTFLESDLFKSEINNSLSPSNVKHNEYAAVYYPGGYGQFFDVVENKDIALLSTGIYENGGVIGTAGHGAVSLINIKLSNTKYFVEDKKMTCFPWQSETTVMDVSDFGKSLPFNMEEVLTQRGARLVAYKKLPEKDQCVVVDNVNRLVTGAYADNSLTVAEEMVKLIQNNSVKKNME